MPPGYRNIVPLFKDPHSLYNRYSCFLDQTRNKYKKYNEICALISLETRSSFLKENANVNLISYFASKIFRFSFETYEFLNS